MNEFGQGAVEINGQRVLDGFGREFADRTSLIDRASETQFPETKSSQLSSYISIDQISLHHNVHDVHDRVIDSQVAASHERAPATAISTNS